MKGIIDFAGLFPPADLELDPAIRNYAKYRRGDDAWMLSRFIIPAAILERLKPYGEELFQHHPTFSFSVLGKGTDTISEFKSELEQLVDACRQFHEVHGDSVATDLMEIKLPKEVALCGDRDLICELLDYAAEGLGRSAISPKYVFYEALFEESWKKDVETITGALQLHNQAKGGQDNYAYAGFKIRCGGLEPSMFPEPEQVAFALNRARNADVALKATAGLHHPVRHYDDTVLTRMHGFFNVFGGGLLAYAHDLSDEELQEILREEDHEQFIFTEEAFSWKDYSISVEEIEELREVALISFGSCSFDEPREDLQKMNLLPNDK